MDQGPDESERRSDFDWGGTRKGAPTYDVQREKNPPDMTSTMYIKLAELGRGSKNTNTLWTSHIEAPKMPVPTSKIERTKRGKLGRSPASSRLILHCETLAWEVSCTYIVHQNYFLPFLLFCQQAMLPCIIQKEHFHSCLGRFQGPQVRLDTPGVWEYTGDHF